MRLLPIFTLVLGLGIAQAQTADSLTKASAHWRPAYHFSPPKNWINDPNGLVYHAGEWHLFYQHNPYENKWGHMSWGHAVSRDLLRWEHLPVAIPEDSTGIDPVWIFSGGVVVDKNNTAGFGKNAFVAIYTADHHGKGEDQHLAYSTDRGRTWTKCRQNPVLGPLQKDFRDPNLIWHESSKQWVMSVVKPTEYKVEFYGSKNLKAWTKLGDFGPAGDVRKIWECPALLQVSVEGGGKKWLLLLSSNGAYEDFVGMQYFVGEFDGKTFNAENKQPLYVDYGKDFYAAIPFYNAPDGRTVMLGWMLSWQYAEAQPTFPWKGQMSVPREISLYKTAGGHRLKQQPVAEVTRNARMRTSIPALAIQGESDALKGVRSNHFELLADVEIGQASGFGLRLAQGENGQQTVVGYDAQKQELYVDRTKSGKVFHPKFASRESAPLKPVNGTVRLRVLLDQSSVEVFGNDGQVAITSLIFPDAQSGRVSLFSRGEIKVKSLKISDL